MSIKHVIPSTLEKSLFFILLNITFTTSNLSAITTTWTGAIDYDWSVAGNWDNGVPGILDSAIIASDSAFIDATVDIAHLNMNQSALVVRPNGKLRIQQSPLIGMICTDSNIYNYGLIRFFQTNAESLLLDGTSIFQNINDGKLFVTDSGQDPLTITSGAQLFNEVNASIKIDSCTGQFINEGYFENYGSISLQVINPKLSEGALANNASLLNMGVINIDSSSNHGATILELGALDNQGSIIIKRCNMNGIRSRGLIENTGFLNLTNNSTGYSDFADGNFNNHGKLIIDSCLTGIKRNALLGFLNTDTIEIKNCALGYYDTGTSFINQGYFIIESFIDIGAWNFGTFHNDTTGHLIVEGSHIGKTGMLNGEPFVPNGVYGILENYGTCEFRNIVDLAINNPNEIFNYDTISIYNVDTAILNTCQFYNIPNGVVSIEQTDLGIVNSGLFENEGMLAVDSSGIAIRNLDTLTNLGNVILTNLDSTSGVWNFSVINNMGFMSIIGTSIGLNNRKTFLNYDTLWIDDALQFGIFNSDSLHIFDMSCASIMGAGTAGIQNIGHIVVDGKAQIQNITNDGIFNNSIGIIDVFGKTTITNVGKDAIDNSGKINNGGTIRIDSTGEDGISNQGIYINSDSLLINYVGGYGFYNFDSTHNTNSGYIKISNVHGSREILLNDFGHTFRSDGQIFLENNMNDGGLLNVGLFINNDLLRIDSTNGNGLRNVLGTFSNSPNGTIDVTNIFGDYGALFNNEFNGTFINEGDITLSGLSGGGGIEPIYGMLLENSTITDFLSSGSLTIENIGINGIPVFVEEEAIFNAFGEVIIYPASSE